MNDARSANCSGHGVGADGGCRVVVSKQSRPSDAPGDDTGYSAQKSDDTEVSFVCECADGYEGEACETQKSMGAVAGADAGVRAERKKEISSAGAVAEEEVEEAEEVEEEDGETARARLGRHRRDHPVCGRRPGGRIAVRGAPRGAHRPRAARGGAAHPKRRLVSRRARFFFLSRHPACRDGASRDDERRARFSDARDDVEEDIFVCSSITIFTPTRALSCLTPPSRRRPGPARRAPPSPRDP